MFDLPRIVLAGLKGGSGKTILSLALGRIWTRQGYQVKPFKKGPDYIDAVWLSRACGQTATNLDPFLMSDDLIKALFFRQGTGSDLCLIEGNRGLFDGKDVDGSCSTSYLARLLKAPVVLIVDCTKSTRTIAALVQGCLSFENDLNLAGIVLNHTAGNRHRRILRQCIETYTNMPVLGTLPKIGESFIPERHMGLISDQEFEAELALDKIADSLEEWISWKEILDIAKSSSKEEVKELPEVSWPREVVSDIVDRPCIGVVRDASLWFYYPENLEALRRAGAWIVEVSLLEEREWPELHGLYLGGGFPETQAKELSANLFVRELVKDLAEKGLPIYAECGGLMYLCSKLEYEGKIYPMSGVFELQACLSSKPQGHGYTRTKVVQKNPFYKLGSEFIGHEFHYSKCEQCKESELETCLQVLRGTGLGKGKDGLIYRNTMASYTHLHALALPEWAENFVLAASRFQESKKFGQGQCSRIFKE